MLKKFIIVIFVFIIAFSCFKKVLNKRTNNSQNPMMVKSKSFYPKSTSYNKYKYYRKSNYNRNYKSSRRR